MSFAGTFPVMAPLPYLMGIPCDRSAKKMSSLYCGRMITLIEYRGNLPQKRDSQASGKPPLPDAFF